MLQHFCMPRALLSGLLGSAIAAPGCYASRERSPGLDARAADVLDAGRGTTDTRSGADTLARPDAPLRADAARDARAECAAEGPGMDCSIGVESRCGLF
jgi:hypothetical protein